MQQAIPAPEVLVDCHIQNEERSQLYFQELSNEIVLKVKQMDDLTSSVTFLRDKFIRLVQNTVKNLFQNKQSNGKVNVELYGSIKTDLAIDSSDVDLTVTGVKEHHYPKDPRP